jgi:hypothetical protein
MGTVPVQHGGMAGGTINTARQLGYAIGIAVLGSVFATRAADSLHALPGSSATAHDLAGGQAPRLLASAGNGRALLDTQLHHASIAGIHGAFLVAGLAGLVSAAVVWLTVRNPAPAPPTWSTDAADASSGQSDEKAAGAAVDTPATVPVGARPQAPDGS